MSLPLHPLLHLDSFSPLPPPPPPRRFADKVSNLRENQNEWKHKGQGKKTKRPSVKGTNKESGDLKGVPPRNFWQFSVTRLDEKTSDDAVRRALHKAGVEVHEVWMLSSKFKGTTRPTPISRVRDLQTKIDLE